MLTAAELAQAEQLFEKLREITQPAPPEFTRDGKELAGLLRCNRTTSWKITKRADFQEAAPAVALGPKLKLRRTRQILAWWEAQAEGKESPGPIGPGARIAMPRPTRHNDTRGY
jgi:hypothetical protein